MYAERLILETDVAGRIKEMPILPANKQMEAIFLVTDDLNLKKHSANLILTLQAKPK